MSKFKVGDRVRYSGTKPGFDKSMVGETGAVTKDDGGIIVGVDWDGSPVWSYGVYRENIELVTPAFKAEAGKTYKTEDGRKVGPLIANYGNEYWPLKAGLLLGSKDYWKEDGTAYWGNATRSNLVSEWVEPAASAKPAAKPEIKVGDWVKRTSSDWKGMKVGDVDQVVEINAIGSIKLAKFDIGHAAYNLEITEAPTVKVVVGKSYTGTDGKTYGPMKSYWSGEFIVEVGDGNVWDSNGKAGSHNNIKVDLVSEVVPVAPTPTYKPGDRVRAVRTSYGFSPGYKAGNTYIVKSFADGCISTEVDEKGSRTNGWGAANFEPAPAYTSNAAAQVDNIKAEYGSPKKAEPKFKVGDRVRRSVGYFNSMNVGDEANIIAIDERSGGLNFDAYGDGHEPSYFELVTAKTAAAFKVGDRIKATTDKPSGHIGKIVKFNEEHTHQKYLVEFETWRGGHSGHPQPMPYGAGWWLGEDQMELAPTTVADIVRKHSGKAIVALIENGQPKPSTFPHVHANVEWATNEAARLAGKHLGQEFGVYELVATRKEAKIYPFAWQQKAADGKVIEAIKEVRAITGLSLKAAKDAVEAWRAAEAA